MTTAAIDVGGANLKLAHSSGTALSVSFAVWRAPERLGTEIARALSRLPRFDRLAVTMTAELCDCFPTKRDGVLAILDALLGALASIEHRVETRVWSNDGRFVTIDDARRDPLSVAAANWLALATYAAPLTARLERALLADLGSTTLDLVPLLRGAPCPSGRTDSDRLARGELVYTGIRRTPVFALARAAPYRGESCPLIPELFATTDDVFLVLDETGEAPGDLDSCDGRPRTREHARARLARTVGADVETFSIADAVTLARHVGLAQRELIASEARRVTRRWSGPPEAIVVAGEGERVVARILRELWPEAELVSSIESIGAAASRAACAWALVGLLDGR